MTLSIVKRLTLLSLIALTALPSHGRFISEDKWEGQQDTAPSLHKYLYAYQNPTVYVDPDGNAPVLAEMTNGLMSQVDYINSRASTYRQQGGLSGNLAATMMNVGAGVHAVLGGAVGLVNTVADVSISGSASRLERYGVEFNEYGIVADSRAHLSDVGTSLKKTANTAANFHDRNVRSELGRGLVETGVGVINGDADALNRFATSSTALGFGGSLSKLNPTRSINKTPSNSGSNVGLITENNSGLAPKLHSNGQANSAQYAKLKAQLRQDELRSHGFLKENGGKTKDDFINEHAFNRHGNNLGVVSNNNRTQFDTNIDVGKLKVDTMNNPDRAYSDIQTRATVYEKKYDFDISTTITDTKTTPVSNSSNTHKVFINPDPELSTQFPLAPRHIKEE